jgi:cysteine desulfurase
VVLDVTAEGTLDLGRLQVEMDAGPVVVSVMWVNNETGMILPVPDVAQQCAEAGGIMHTDAVQEVGKVRVRVDETPIDLLTVTGHKIYGPKGTGLLYVREGTALDPIIHGGGQERSLRPGTEDVAGAVGLAEAMRLVVQEREAEVPRLNALRTQLETEISARLGGIRVNGGNAPRASHVANLAIEGVDGSMLIMALDLEGVAASGGAACNSGTSGGSHVLAALYGADDPHASVRFSFGRGTTSDHVERAVASTVAIVTRLREGAAA